jgi:hypothetical protein
MQPNSSISTLEKFISIVSYFTMGLFGLFWLIIAYSVKKKLRYFLQYNIVQSLLISILLAIFNLLIDIIFSLLSLIPIFDGIIAILNWFISVKVISIYYFSFSIFELIIFLLLGYISIGVLINKISYVPCLTNLVQRIMKNYV